MYRIDQTISIEGRDGAVYPFPARYPSLAEACNGIRLFRRDAEPVGYAVADQAPDYSHLTLKHRRLSVTVHLAVVEEVQP